MSAIEEIMRTLLFLDESNGIKLSAQEVITEDGREVKRISLSIMGMDGLLEEWYEKQKALQKGGLRRKNITSGR